MNKNLNLKYGDKITYKSKLNNKITSLCVTGYDGYTIEEFEDEINEVLKVERPTNYKTIYEVKEILDEKEKEYLSYVIKPFRDNVRGITKYFSIVNFDEHKEWIVIGIYKNQEIILPRFEKGTMYKGMSLNREYSLKELGL